MAPGPYMQPTPVVCTCGQQVDALGNDPKVRLSRVHQDLAVHQGPDGRWHACCHRNPLRSLPATYLNHVEE
jgi:hypothetical protein